MKLKFLIALQDANERRALREHRELNPVEIGLRDECAQALRDAAFRVQVAETVQRFKGGGPFQFHALIARLESLGRE